MRPSIYQDFAELIPLQLLKDLHKTYVDVDCRVCSCVEQVMASPWAAKRVGWAGMRVVLAVALAGYLALLMPCRCLF